MGVVEVVALALDGVQGELVADFEEPRNVARQAQPADVDCSRVGRGALVVVGMSSSWLARGSRGCGLSSEAPLALVTHPDGPTSCGND
ncbi:hypothetical protein [Cellulomonas denverensis]|uniref:Uncharacterized protein n=1 Tax=Cellulomonas denverensis TaxID=264297 RepID=A0A7X6KSV6_9CELL|nr:hypothetical protein [Cellulomonas denverensis]NKY21495.1 hypothetical protein [Cellulomonas denverensis]